MSKEICLVLNTETQAVTPVAEADIFCGTCGFIDCICQVQQTHLEGCLYLAAMRCPVGIECQHGYDVCPTCDPCTCEKVRAKKLLQA
jgi:hypothetical protein